MQAFTAYLHLMIFVECEYIQYHNEEKLAVTEKHKHPAMSDVIDEIE